MTAAVLFDLFGTLVHLDPARLPAVDVGGRRLRTTAPALVPIVQQWVPGVTVSALWHAVADASAGLVAERDGAHREAPSRERFHRTLIALGVDPADAAEGAIAVSRRHHAMLAEATIVPDPVRATFEAIAGRWPVAVVSNFDDTTSALRILDRHHLLNALASVVVSEAIGVRKPSPVPVRIALRDLGVTSGILVGDTFDEDVGAAHAAGIDAAWIDVRGAGVPAGQPEPRWVVRALSELGPLLGA